MKLKIHTQILACLGHCPGKVVLSLRLIFRHKRFPGLLSCHGLSGLQSPPNPYGKLVFLSVLCYHSPPGLALQAVIAFSCPSLHSRDAQGEYDLFPPGTEQPWAEQRGYLLRCPATPLNMPSCQIFIQQNLNE